VSPIIATILIIVVSLVLVAILVSWGQNFVQRNTSQADNSIDTSCMGADLSVSYCEYSSVEKKLSFVLTNSGDIIFPTDSNFFLTLIDANKDLNSSNTNILDSNSFGIGEAKKIEIEDYNAVSPIRMTIRNTKCSGFFKEVVCR
jgi:FlaG/FlaF family flagellin (archaellin)